MKARVPIGSPASRIPSGSTLHARLRPQQGDTAREPGLLGGCGDEIDVLVRAGRFFGGAAHGARADQDPVDRKLVDLIFFNA